MRKRINEHDRYGYPTSKWHWGSWETLEYPEAKKADSRLEFWRSLNDYAVSQRGVGARAEFDVVPMEAV
jgi:hypothetical protein